MFYNRWIQIANIPLSQFLFGVRQAGKTYYLKNQLNYDLYIDLLKQEERHELQREPKILEYRILQIQSNKKTVIIDEIQKAPKLLDEIQRLIELFPDCRFILTGSSARKLKHNQSNMLGGRALQNFLFPLTYKELGQQFNLKKMLQFGGLPLLWSKARGYEAEVLSSYAETYLKQEIMEEALTRNIPAFAQFLELAALENGNGINYTNFARETAVSSKLIKEYYNILEDTLLGFFLRPFTKSHRKRLQKQARFYFIDNGIAFAASKSLKRELIPGSTEYGKAFETFVLSEIYKAIHYNKMECEMTYFLTSDGAEVDLILSQHSKIIAVEIKSSANPRTPSGLLSFIKDHQYEQAFCLTTAETAMKRGDIIYIPWKQFIDKLYEGTLFV